MADDAALTRGIIVILRECLELSPTIKDAELAADAGRLLAQIKAGESEMAIRAEVAKIQQRLSQLVNDDTCKEVASLVRKLVVKNSN
jgi:hypothetical protein